jgi:hypothetical protein
MAVSDYSLWLEKKYPQKIVLKLVGDHYALSNVQRSMLYRGITTKENSENRSSRLIRTADIKNQVLHIDTYNVLITISSYLTGTTVFVSTDSFLRDCTEVHGKFMKPDIVNTALDLILRYIATLRVSAAIFYIDKPVDNSNDIYEIIKKLCQDWHINGTAHILESPDALLKNLTHGICASSDSVIIDKSQIPVFDLPCNCIQQYYKPNFIDLRQYL